LRSEDGEIANARVYDDVAETYERVNVPRLFAEPARRLVAAVDPPAGARIVDVGCGTGAVARAALEALGGAARLVAVDASLSMLLAARRCGIQRTVVGRLPVLPFRDGSFDVALAAFVMTHLDDPDAAAADMVRVLRPGGRLGVSAWAPATDAYAQAWREAATRFIDADRLDAAARIVLPGDARFSRPGGVAQLLDASGLQDVRSVYEEIDTVMSVDEYIEAREVCASGRVIRVLVSVEEWNRFRAHARAFLHARFGEGVSFRRGIHIAVGTRLR
jgi:ubiquinone/menaquinone biosynthesis C-methylase UbiE